MLAFVPQKVIIYRLCGLLALMLLVNVCRAGLPVRNQNPLAVFVGLPELKTAKKLDDDEQVTGLNTTLNNHFMAKTDKPDPLFFDGESYIGDFFWRRGISGWEWEIMLPYISYQKGFMDSFVIHWHDAFNLPNGNRGKFPESQLKMSYAGLLLDEPVQGLGDVRITLGKPLQQHVNYQHALHITLKLPTGDSDHWLGSGGTDIGIFSTHAWQQDEWQEELQFGLLGMETPDILPSERHKLAGYINSAITYSLSEAWSVIVQYDAHTALYKDSQLATLGDGHILSFASRWQLADWAWHLAILEDIKVDSAPDVGFQLGLEFGDIQN